MRIVVLTGKDAFLRLERSRALQDALVAAHGQVDRFDLDGAGASLSSVLDELRSYGLLSQHKLVVVDNAEQFLGAEDRRRAMERYAEHPQPESTLLMRAGQRWNPGRLDKLVEAAGGAVLKCEPPAEADAIRWCGERARAHLERARERERKRLRNARHARERARVAGDASPRRALTVIEDPSGL